MAEPLSVLLIKHQRNKERRIQAVQDLKTMASQMDINLSGGLMAKIKAVASASSNSDVQPLIIELLEATDNERDSLTEIVMVLAHERLEYEHG